MASQAKILAASYVIAAPSQLHPCLGWQRQSTQETKAGLQWNDNGKASTGLQVNLTGATEKQLAEVQSQSNPKIADLILLASHTTWALSERGNLSICPMKMAPSEPALSSIRKLNASRMQIHRKTEPNSN